MRCQRCGKPITPLRQLTDREFCCDQHRKRGALASASAFRDIDSTDELGWVSGQAEQKPHSNKMAASLALVMLVMVGGLVAARLWMPQGVVGGVSSIAAALPNASPLETAGLRGGPPRDSTTTRMFTWLEDHLPGDKPIRARSSFTDSLDEWTAEARSGARNLAWRVSDGAAQPGAMRLWKPTLLARDYDLRFLGEIDRKAMSWSFRATDTGNYYATKLVIGAKADTSTLIRYVVEGAKTVEKVEMPMPITLHAMRPYQVSVSVRGNRFLTLLDGHIIDEWDDSRLAAGGVGFYADTGESATIHWADFRERKGLLSRLFAANLFMSPAALSAAMAP